MPTTPPITVDQIRRAARKLAELRPSYAAMLAFYEELFVSQEEAKGEIHLEPIQLSPEEQKKRPLAAVPDFVIDAPAAGRLLARLCDLVVAHDTGLKPSAMAVATAVAGGELAPESLFERLLAGDDGYFHATAGRIGAQGDALVFLAYHSLQPSLELCAAQLAAYLDTEAVWNKSFCPVCGSAPGLAVLGEEGRRVIACSFCRHQWQAPRIFCVFCENTKADELPYVFAEEERDLRVDGCDRCRNSIKTVDRRKISRPLFPPLEQVASLHLDMIAAEKGYRSGAAWPTAAKGD